LNRLLCLALLVLLAERTTGQARFVASPLEGGPSASSPAPRDGDPPPVSNPEPVTLVALAGAAALVGSLLRRRKLAK
jgi:hypothetical protein